MKPAYHPNSLWAWTPQFPRSTGFTYPVFAASPGVAGLPTTTFSDGTPLLIIYKTDVPGK